MASVATKIPIQIQFEPFLLNADGISEDGVDLVEYIAGKYGLDFARQIENPNNPLQLAGRKVNINFNSKRKIVPTIKCHQLMEWANRRSVEDGNKLMQALFKHYFELGQMVNKREQLLRIAADVFPASALPEISQLLDGNTFVNDILMKDRMVKQKLKVSGVPFFIIGENGISGAQPPSVLAKMLVDASN